MKAYRAVLHEVLDARMPVDYTTAAQREQIEIWVARTVQSYDFAIDDTPGFSN